MNRIAYKLFFYQTITGISSEKCPHITGCCLFFDNARTLSLTNLKSSFADIVLSRLESALPRNALTKQVVKKPFFISFLSIEVSLSREDKNNITFDFSCSCLTSVVPCLIFQKNKHQQKSSCFYNELYSLLV